MKVKKVLKWLFLALLAMFVSVLVLVGVIYFYVSADADLPPRTASSETVRQIENGELIGFENDNGTHTWLGIPYARAPLAELRWKAPRPAADWSGTLEALDFGNNCAQGEKSSEDCLYLNVWAPGNQTGNKPLPVMLWIHGGGNTGGGGQSISYNGAKLAGRHDVVVITINYRLGPLGWFRHPALSTGSPEDDSGNYGTLDIIQALKWVQTNIASFGGDPDKVTIFGESAGGFNVLSMQASPLAKGLFHRAIVQSGGLDITNVDVAAQSAREAVNNMLLIDGKVADRDAANRLQETMSPQELASYLTGKSADQIIAAHQHQAGSGDSKGSKAASGGSVDILGDGHVLPKDMKNAEIFSDTNNYNAVPVVLGTNRDEGTFFAMFDSNLVDHSLGFIPVGFKDEAAYVRAVRYGSDQWKLSGVDSLAIPMKTAQGDGVFAYRWDVDDLRHLGFIDLNVLLGASHGMEVPFVFGNLTNSVEIYYKGLMTPEVAQVSDSMMSYWAEFAYTGDPGKGRTGREVLWSGWQNGDANNPRLLVLDSAGDQGIRMSSERVTGDSLKAEFLSDRSFTDQQQYCEAYLNLFPDDNSGSKENLFVAAEYASLGRGGCGH
jgi:para-nitrobenzyl esterase